MNCQQCGRRLDSTQDTCPECYFDAACEFCGHPVDARQCKVICENCGHMRDCSDP